MAVNPQHGIMSEEPVSTIEEASKTIHNLEKVTVLEQTGNISDNKIAEYFVLLDIEFSIDENMRNEKCENN